MRVSRVQKSQSILITSPHKKMQKLRARQLPDGLGASAGGKHFDADTLGPRSPISNPGTAVKKRYLGDRTYLKTQKVNSPLVSANLRFQEAFKGIRKLRKEAIGSQ